MDPNLSSPSANSHSMPEIRGEPSARNVAIVLCLPASNRRRTRAANSGSACSTSFHAAIAAVCAQPPAGHRRPRVLGRVAGQRDRHPAGGGRREPGGPRRRGRGVPAYEILTRVGELGYVGGQEDMIIDVAIELAQRKEA